MIARYYGRVIGGGGAVEGLREKLVEEISKF